MAFLNNLKARTYNSTGSLAVFAVSLFIAVSGHSQESIRLPEEFYDFGHVGIDYRIFHTFKVINTGIKDIKVDSVNVLCDCSSVLYDKHVLGPNDTLELKLTFDTRDFYGPVNRKLLVFLSLPEKRVVTFIYLAEVGQWKDGLKPEPFALFMLPTHQQQSLKITNRYFDSITGEIQDKNDDFFDVEFVKDDAGKEEALEIRVVPHQDLKKGTYLSNFTLKVTADDKDNPTYLTVPVKIARF